MVSQLVGQCHFRAAAALRVQVLFQVVPVTAAMSPAEAPVGSGAASGSCRGLPLLCTPGRRF